MRLLIFLGTWVVVSFVYGYIVGGAAKLGGPEDPRRVAR